ncbi:S41 family peptidase [bacterium]|nr:S41 family peptidase [bacterium]
MNQFLIFKTNFADYLLSFRIYFYTSLMIKKIQLLVIFLTFSVFGHAQAYSFGKKISPEQLKEDFSILVTSLQENHPGLYDFSSKAKFDSLVVENLRAMNDSLTADVFHVRVRKFLHVIGCGHTSARPSKDWYKFVREQDRIIPMHVFLYNEELYVRGIITDSIGDYVGARIVAVNDVPSQEILAELKSITGHDGVGETMVDKNVERLFQTLYTFFYGLRDVYYVDLEFKNGVERELRLEGGNAKKYFVDKPDVYDTEIEVKEAKFGFVGGSKKVAVMKLNSFPLKGYKKFYKKVFKRLSDYDSVDLVIDLRGNGGGYFPNGNELLKYLMNEKFTMDIDKPQKHTKNNKHLKLNIFSHITRFILSTIPDKNKEDPDRNYQIRHKPIKRNHFGGGLYILMDGLSFSASSFVTSKLKKSRGAIVVGEESGGGEVGFNAVLSWDLNLPNSGLRVSVPVYHVDIQPEMEDVGRGVIPNLPVNYSLDDKIDGLDLEMQLVLRLLSGK